MFVDFNILNQLGSPSINSNTFANRPSAGQVGRLFVSTDTFEIYRDNGTGWDLIGGPGSSTVTGSGAAGQVTYWTGTNSVGGENNLWWDAANNRFGVNTNTPTAAAEVVQTDGVALYSNFTTNAGSGTGTTALWAINNTNSSGYAAVIEEKTPNTTAGQYPLVVKHSLSSGTAGIGMGTGLHFQLPDDAGTYKTTQLTIETIDAAAATYKTRYRFMVQNNGSSTAVAYLNSTGLGLFTATPGAALDVHSTGTIAQFNTTSGTGNTYIAFQRTGTGIWRIGDTYNGGNNFFELHNTVLGVDAMEFQASTNKSTFQSQETYTTGLARGNYFDYNLSVAAGGSFSSPNAITSLGASLDLTLAGNATIPSGARSGLDAYNSIAFTGTGTLTQNQGSQLRTYANFTTGWAFNGSATGTITHLSGIHVRFPDNSGSAIAITNNYGLLINDQTANTGTVTYTNRWGIYQEGASDLNYFNGNLLLGTTTNVGSKINVNGKIRLNNDLEFATSGGTVTGIIFGDTNNLVLRQQSTAGLQIQTVAGGVIMSATTAGLFGFGTATPAASYRVTISGSTYLVGTNSRIYVDNGGVGGSSAIIGVLGSSYGYLNTDGAFPFVFQTNSTERARITSAGEFGIGTNNPQYTFHTVSANTTIGAFRISSAAAGQLLVGNSLSDTGIRTLATGDSIVFSDTSRYLAFGTSGATERARITSGGNFLIGTTTDTGYKLQVNGNQYISSYLYVGTSVRLSTSNSTFKATTHSDWAMQIDSPWATATQNYGLYISYTNASPNNTANQFINCADNSVTRFEVQSNGNIVSTGSIKTAAPNTGTAAAWKLGSRVGATVVVNTTEYIEIDIGGTLYKLATVT